MGLYTLLPARRTLFTSLRTPCDTVKSSYDTLRFSLKAGNQRPRVLTSNTTRRFDRCQTFFIFFIFMMPRPSNRSSHAVGSVVPR